MRKEHPCGECDFVGSTSNGLNKHKTTVHGHAPTTVEGRQAKRLRDMKQELDETKALLLEFKQEQTLAYQIKALGEKIDMLVQLMKETKSE